MREITAIALDITTVCNLHCPECCCAIGMWRKPVHYDWLYFKGLAKYVYGIDRIDITGGEPTAHPDFAAFAMGFRQLFGCRQLTLESNGFRLRENESVLGNFDLIRLSRYGDNDDVIDWALSRFPSYVQNGSTCSEIQAGGDARGHIPRSRRGGGGPCNLGRCEFVACSDGLFYPCRLGPGIKGAESIVPCADWREKIRKVPLPCQECHFSLYSQNDEQYLILQAVGDHIGRFLDIGANDGHYMSNTLALVERGWSGVLVEPNPWTFVKLVERHGDNPRLTLVNVAVGLEWRLSKFWPATADTGLSTTEDGQRERRRNRAAYRTPHHIAMVPLDLVLKRFDGPIDVLSIDTEGTSAELFLQFPVEKYQPKAMCIEHDGKYEQCFRHASRFGYREVGRNDENLVFAKEGKCA